MARLYDNSVKILFYVDTNQHEGHEFLMISFNEQTLTYVRKGRTMRIVQVGTGNSHNFNQGWGTIFLSQAILKVIIHMVIVINTFHIVIA